MMNNSEMLTTCAEAIIDRLYELAIRDNRIMVCDWLAYATLTAYRRLNELTGDTYLPSLDDCFNGSAVPVELTYNPKWRILKSMHDFHWNRANTPEWEAEYECYFNIVAIQLDDILLCQ